MASTDLTGRAVLQRNLRVLIRDIESYAAGEEVCRQRLASTNSAIVSIWSSIPLGHSRGAASFQSIAKNGSIFSREELKRRGMIAPGGETERLLGTADYVFSYVGPLRYPATSCGLFFLPHVETALSERAIATPFDSGAVLKHFRPGESREQQVAFLHRHEMPVPEYREYFRRALTLLFESPWHYIEGPGPDVKGPLSIEGGDARRWTFEVRFAKELQLEGVLKAVILPVALAAATTTAISRWKRAGVQVKYYVTPDPIEATEWQSLYAASLQCLREWL